MSILILEDTESTRKFICTCLKDFQHESYEYPTEEIVERSINGDFKAIITDLKMPYMCGLNFATRVRAKNSKVPIFIWTCDRGFCFDEYSDIFTQQIPKPIKNILVVKQILAEAIHKGA